MHGVISKWCACLGGQAARAVLLAIWLPATAQAHVGENVQPQWQPTWSFEPWVVAGLLLSLAGYAAGVYRLWSHAGRGRGVQRRQVAAFAGGWLALVVALVSPLDPLGGQLFSAHMLQHELLMVVAAPLLCLAQPLVAWTWALPMAARRAAGRWLRHPAWMASWQLLTAPLAAWTLHAVLLWGWHLPALFELALRDDDLHTLQHFSFLGSALLFWWSALRSVQRERRGQAVVYLFTTMLHTGFLGALLTLSDRVWYAPYLATAAALGLDPIEDQQLGGLVMWVPAGLAYLVSGLAMCARWFGDEPGDRGLAPPRDDGPGPWPVPR